MNLTEVLYATEGDTTFARGRNYKAESSPDGFTFIPFLGSDAPQNYPVEFRLEQVTLGGDSLGLSSTARVTQTENRIQLDRGPVREWYDMNLNFVEQSFALNLGEVAQELVLTLAVETELQTNFHGSGIRYTGALGGVTYGKALVFDAEGKTLELPIEGTLGQIQLRVPASYLATAVAPLVVDPIIATYNITTPSNADIEQPDVAFSGFYDRFVYVAVEDFSSTDKDLYLATYNALTGAFVASGYADLSSNVYFAPAIANDWGTGTCMVVCNAGPSGLEGVYGKFVYPGTLGSSSWQSVGGALSGSPGYKCTAPDVGGNSGTPYGFQVVWSREYNFPNTSEVITRHVNASLVLGTETSLQYQNNARVPSVKISKSTGEAGNSEWRVVWIRAASAFGSHTVRGARISNVNALLLSTPTCPTPSPPSTSPKDWSICPESSPATRSTAWQPPGSKLLSKMWW